jgi:hypothetical protein
MKTITIVTMIFLPAAFISIGLLMVLRIGRRLVLTIGLESLQYDHVRLASQRWRSRIVTLLLDILGHHLAFNPDDSHNLDIMDSALER